MIRLLTAVLLFASFSVVADTEVPHTFQDGEVIDAQKFNEDFNALEAAIDANAAALPPTNCTTDQIIRWDGTNNVWVCATGDLAGLVCEEEDTITFRNGTWQCSSATQNCTTYYRDFDFDGYGDPTNSQCLSSPTGYYTATNANDCYDFSPNANPAQTEWFSSDRGDGSYDYDCDGQQERLYTAVGSCQAVVTGCNYNPGWSGGSVPSCGITEDWITGCDYNVLAIRCDEVNTPQTQTCQ